MRDIRTWGVAHQHEIARTRKWSATIPHSRLEHPGETNDSGKQQGNGVRDVRPGRDSVFGGGRCGLGWGRGDVAARDPKQAVDEAYTAKMKKYTTEPFFTSPLVDYLPASKNVPTPEAVLGDVAGAPGILPYPKRCTSTCGCWRRPARA